MSKKLEIGDEIVIYPEGGLDYTSLKTKNGCKNQAYHSSNFPIALTAVFLGIKKGKDGKWYEKYTLKSIPEELDTFNLYGKVGFENLIEELNKISEILQGKAEDGRKILYPRSINIEDVNEILGVVVDYKNKRIYQKNNPSKDINEAANFGKIRKILPREANMCRSINSEFIRGNQLESTTYNYSIKDLKISEKRKRIVELNVKYHLASYSVDVSSTVAFFCESYIYNGIVETGVYLFVSTGGLRCERSAAARPVFYLESNIQNEIIKRTTERTTERKIVKRPSRNKSY